MPTPRIIETLKNRLNADTDTPGSPGGNTTVLKAEAAGLKIGDVVSVSTITDLSVKKTAVAADGTKFAGVVVGGGSTGGADYAIFDPASVGLSLAAGVGQGANIGMSTVIQTDGIATSVAGGVIARGATIGFDTTTAGRVLANAVAGQIIGVALTVGANNGQVTWLISPR